MGRDSGEGEIGKNVNVTHALKINQCNKFYPYWTMEKCLKPRTEMVGEGCYLGRRGIFEIKVNNSNFLIK